MNAQHLATTGSWFTPPRYIEATVRVIGPIDLDPCSCARAQLIVKARRFYTAADDPLNRWWGSRSKTGYCNSPGSCDPDGDKNFGVCGNDSRCSCKLPMQFLTKCIEETRKGMDIIYTAYSVNMIRQIPTDLIIGGLGLTMAVPKVRVAYIDPVTMEPRRETPCDSAFLCLSKDDKIHGRFMTEFSNENCVVYRLVMT